MLSRARDNVGWPTAVIIIVLALCPLVFRNVTVQSVLVVAMIYAVGAVGLDLLTGYSGQFSFGQFVYFAFGAYVMSALVLREHWPWALALVAAVAGAGVLAAIVGAAMVRLRFFGSAVGTFFMGAAAVDLINGQHLKFWTGGSNGIAGPAAAVGSVSLTTGYGLYFAAVIGLALAAAVCVRYTKIRAGFAARVIKENEIVAATLGIRVFREKLRAQVIAGAAGALGGCLLALNLGYLSPDSFDVSQSIELFAIVAVGGTGSIAGPIIGSVFFFGAVNGLSTSGSWSELVFALILLAVVIFLHRGLYDLGEQLVRRGLAWRRRSGRAGGARMDSAAAEPVPGAAGAVPAVPDLDDLEGLASLAEPVAQAAGGADRRPETLLQVREVSVDFGGVKALHGVSLDVRRGEVHAIIGPNGAGKTTFLNCISGLQPLSGVITLEGTDLAPLSVSQRRQRGIARTFQHPSLVADLSVLRNVTIGAYERQTGSLAVEMLGLPAPRRRHREAHERAVAALRDLEFPAGRWHEFAGDITMGEQKHVDIARAMAGQPALLLLDEPTAGLGGEEVAAVAHAIEAVRDAGVTILVIAHHVGFIRQIADWCTVLDFGQVIASGPPAEVLEDPRVVEIFVGTGAKA